tara:strand:+ start:916 stop:1170 length:255 start_codon:yes stop_codon:yes gene_type:complete
LIINFFKSYLSLLIIITEVSPPDNNPTVKELPMIKPIGRGTVLFTRKSKVYLFPRFCDPRQRNKINSIAVEIFSVKSCNLKNIK